MRLDPGRRAAVAVGGAVLVAAVATGLWLLASRPRALPVASTPSPIAGAVSPAGSSVAPLPPSSAADVVVDVAGKVHRPGLYRLRAGARVDDALRAAGGALPGVELNSLNLAAKVSDGQQVLVGLAPPMGVVADGAAGASAGAPTGASTAGLVSLNSATLEQLDALPGVGPVLAQHILDWRAEHGGFAAVSQLQDVSGIGPAKYDTLKNLVTL